MVQKSKSISREQGPLRIIEEQAEKIWEELCEGNYEALGLGSMEMDVAIETYLSSVGAEPEVEKVIEIYTEIVKSVGSVIRERGIPCLTL